MPFRSATGGFTGNNNVATFIDQIVSPFLTDAFGSGGLAWISQVPSRGKGTTPKFEFLFHRGSIGTPAPPYWFMQTAARTLFIYSGSGVDTSQESFDQPGNPANEPPSDPVVDLTSGSMMSPRCLALPTVIGSYDSYWLFGGPSADYCHVVLKVGAREYRHFHIGMLTPLHTDLHADSFYVTNHRWGYLDPDALKFAINDSANTQNFEHQPYRGHLTPFGNNNKTNLSVGIDIRSRGMWVYSPAFGTENYDWWLMTGDPEQPLPSGGGAGTSVYGQFQNTTQPASVRSVDQVFKDIGTINDTAGDIVFGAGFVSGYDDSLGAIPWAAEPTFTTDGVMLVPIYVGLHSDFESALRWAPVAQVPDVFRVNMKSLDAEQEITIGSDTYVVFPMINKDANNTIDGEGYSGYEGLAYKKITADAS